MVPDLPIF